MIGENALLNFEEASREFLRFRVDDSVRKYLIEAWKREARTWATTQGGVAGHADKKSTILNKELDVHEVFYHDKLLELFSNV